MVYVVSTVWHNKSNVREVKLVSDKVSAPTTKEEALGKVMISHADLSKDYSFVMYVITEVKKEDHYD